jgi:hypothetical protein
MASALGEASPPEEASARELFSALSDAGLTEEARVERAKGKLQGMRKYVFDLRRINAAWSAVQDMLGSSNGQSREVAWNTMATLISTNCGRLGVARWDFLLHALFPPSPGAADHSLQHVVLRELVRDGRRLDPMGDLVGSWLVQIHRKCTDKEGWLQFTSRLLLRAPFGFSDRIKRRLISSACNIAIDAVVRGEEDPTGGKVARYALSVLDALTQNPLAMPRSLEWRVVVPCLALLLESGHGEAWLILDRMLQGQFGIVTLRTLIQILERAHKWNGLVVRGCARAALTLAWGPSSLAVGNLLDLEPAVSEGIDPEALPASVPYDHSVLRPLLACMVLPAVSRSVAMTSDPAFVALAASSLLALVCFHGPTLHMTWKYVYECLISLRAPLNAVSDTSSLADVLSTIEAILRLQEHDAVDGDHSLLQSMLLCYADASVSSRLALVALQRRKLTRCISSVAAVRSTGADVMRPVEVSLEIDSSASLSLQEQLSALMQDAYLVESSSSVREQALCLLRDAWKLLRSGRQHAKTFASPVRLTRPGLAPLFSPPPLESRERDSICSMTPVPPNEYMGAQMQFGPLPDMISQAFIPTLAHVPLDADAGVRVQGMMMLAELALAAETERIVPNDFFVLLCHIARRYSWSGKLARLKAHLHQIEPSAIASFVHNPWRREGSSESHIPKLMLVKRISWALSPALAHSLASSSSGPSSLFFNSSREVRKTIVESILRCCRDGNRINDAAVVAACGVSRIVSAAFGGGAPPGTISDSLTTLAGLLASPLDGDLRVIALRSLERLVADEAGRAVWIDWEAGSFAKLPNVFTSHVQIDQLRLQALVASNREDYTRVAMFMSKAESLQRDTSRVMTPSWEIAEALVARIQVERNPWLFFSLCKMLSSMLINGTILFSVPMTPLGTLLFYSIVTGSFGRQIVRRAISDMHNDSFGTSQITAAPQSTANPLPPFSPPVAPKARPLDSPDWRSLPALGVPAIQPGVLDSPAFGSRPALLTGASAHVRHIESLSLAGPISPPAPPASRRVSRRAQSDAAATQGVASTILSRLRDERAQAEPRDEGSASSHGEGEPSSKITSPLSPEVTLSLPTPVVAAEPSFVSQLDVMCTGSELLRIVAPQAMIAKRVRDHAVAAALLSLRYVSMVLCSLLGVEETNKTGQWRRVSLTSQQASGRRESASSRHMGLLGRSQLEGSTPVGSPSADRRDSLALAGSHRGGVDLSESVDGERVHFVNLARAAAILRRDARALVSIIANAGSTMSLLSAAYPTATVPCTPALLTRCKELLGLAFGRLSPEPWFLWPVLHWLEVQIPAKYSLDAATGHSSPAASAAAAPGSVTHVAPGLRVLMSKIALPTVSIVSDLVFLSVEDPALHQEDDLSLDSGLEKHFTGTSPPQSGLLHQPDVIIDIMQLMLSVLSDAIPALPLWGCEPPRPTPGITTPRVVIRPLPLSASDLSFGCETCPTMTPPPFPVVEGATAHSEEAIPVETLASVSKVQSLHLATMAHKTLSTLARAVLAHAGTLEGEALVEYARPLLSFLRSTALPLLQGASFALLSLCPTSGTCSLFSDLLSPSFVSGSCSRDDRVEARRAIAQACQGRIPSNKQVQLASALCKSHDEQTSMAQQSLVSSLFDVFHATANQLQQLVDPPDSTDTAIRNIVVSDMRVPREYSHDEGGLGSWVIGGPSFVAHTHLRKDWTLQVVLRATEATIAWTIDLIILSPVVLECLSLVVSGPVEMLQRSDEGRAALQVVTHGVLPLPAQGHASTLAQPLAQVITASLDIVGFSLPTTIGGRARSGLSVTHILLARDTEGATAEAMGDLSFDGVESVDDRGSIRGTTPPSSESARRLRAVSGSQRPHWKAVFGDDFRSSAKSSPLSSPRQLSADASSEDLDVTGASARETVTPANAMLQTHNKILTEGARRRLSMMKPVAEREPPNPAMRAREINREVAQIARVAAHSARRYGFSASQNPQYAFSDDEESDTGSDADQRPSSRQSSLSSSVSQTDEVQSIQAKLSGHDPLIDGEPVAAPVAVSPPTLPMMGMTPAKELPSSQQTTTRAVMATREPPSPLLRAASMRAAGSALGLSPRGPRAVGVSFGRAPPRESMDIDFLRPSHRDMPPALSLDGGSALNEHSQGSVTGSHSRRNVDSFDAAPMIERNTSEASTARKMANRANTQGRSSSQGVTGSSRAGLLAIASGRGISPGPRPPMNDVEADLMGTTGPEFIPLGRSAAEVEVGELGVGGKPFMPPTSVVHASKAKGTWAGLPVDTWPSPAGSPTLPSAVGPSHTSGFGAMEGVFTLASSVAAPGNLSQERVERWKSSLPLDTPHTVEESSVGDPRHSWMLPASKVALNGAISPMALPAIAPPSSSGKQAVDVTERSPVLSARSSVPSGSNEESEQAMPQLGQSGYARSEGLPEDRSPSSVSPRRALATPAERRMSAGAHKKAQSSAGAAGVLAFLTSNSSAKSSTGSDDDKRIDLNPITVPPESMVSPNAGEPAFISPEAWSDTRHDVQSPHVTRTEHGTPRSRPDASSDFGGDDVQSSGVAKTAAGCGGRSSWHGSVNRPLMSQLHRAVTSPSPDSIRPTRVGLSINVPKRSSPLARSMTSPDQIAALRLPASARPASPIHEERDGASESTGSSSDEPVKQVYKSPAREPHRTMLSSLSRRPKQQQHQKQQERPALLPAAWTRHKNRGSQPSVTGAEHAAHRSKFSFHSSGVLGGVAPSGFLDAAELWTGRPKQEWNAHTAAMIMSGLLSRILEPESRTPQSARRMVSPSEGPSSASRLVTVAKAPKAVTALRTMHLLDRTPAAETMKVGVVFVRPGQRTMNDALKNQGCGSVAFQQFLRRLGRFVPVKGHDRYLGGLDYLGGRDGQWTVVWDSLGEGFRMAFHVASLIAESDDSEPASSLVLHQRKSHIGNDVVVVVWADSHWGGFSLDAVGSEVTRVIILVQPAGPGFSRVSVMVSDRVLAFGPVGNSVGLGAAADGFISEGCSSIEKICVHSIAKGETFSIGVEPTAADSRMEIPSLIAAGKWQGSSSSVVPTWAVAKVVRLIARNADQALRVGDSVKEVSGIEPTSSLGERRLILLKSVGKLGTASRPPQHRRGETSPAVMTSPIAQL